jgi:glutathione S-transferase
MASLTLFCFPGACSRATMIALEETGAPYAKRLVNLRAGAQKNPDYLALNPKGKVPTLLVDGTPLTENVAVLGYLADAFPAARLLPPTSDALARAQAVSAVGWLSSTVLPLFSRLMRPAAVCDIEGAAERMGEIARDDIHSNLAIADRHMRDREWWIHEWSAADAYLFYIEGNALRQGLELSAFPALAAHEERMRRRPSVQRTLAWEKEAMEQLQAA